MKTSTGSGRIIIRELSPEITEDISAEKKGLMGSTAIMLETLELGERL